MDLEENINIAKILIVDDIATNIDVLRNALVDKKFHIFVATSGEETLDLIDNIQPDIILLDVMMGGIDGFETCRRIRERDNFTSTPIIFVTAKSEAKDIAEAFSSGGSDYITKPIKFEEVKARVDVQYRLWKSNFERKKLIAKLEKNNQQLLVANEAVLKANEEIKNNQDKIIQSEKLKSLSSMIVNVAHEIDNPCNFVIHNIGGVHKTSSSLKTALYEILPTDSTGERIKSLLNPKFEKIDELVQLSKEGAKRIVSIIKSLREFTSDENYQSSKVLKSINTNTIVQNSVDLLSHLLENVQLVTDLEKDLFAECYSEKITQVITNIISNSIHASKHGPNTPVVKVRAYKQDDFVNFEIIDNGEGIPEESKSKLFDPSHITKPITEGSRIGLSISYEIIKSHSGNIYYSSGPKGTTFNILIPTLAKEAKIG